MRYVPEKYSGNNTVFGKFELFLLNDCKHMTLNTGL